MGSPADTIKLMGLYSEMRRRNVFKVAMLYVIVAWLLLRATDYLLPRLGFPHWADEFVVVLVLIGFPLALFFAYIYEVTPEGLKKAVDVDQTQSIVYKTGQKLNAALAVLLVLVIASLAVSRLFPTFPIDDEEPAAHVAKPGIPSEIRSRTLENGLQIIVWPDHDIPNVVMYNFVRVGSRNEYPGITGLSHFFEHMMFNGTSTREPGEFDRIMEAAGGANNAYTSSDVTVYQNWFPRSALEVIFELEADRLENLTTDPEVFESERGVVASERRTAVDDNNLMRLYEQVQATAYVAHPYQFPVIGWPSDIEGWTHEDVMDFYRTYYAPNNLTMVFTGDVTATEIFALAEDYFEPIPAQQPPDPIRTVEPEQQGERRLIVEVDAQTPMLHMAFHVGAAHDPATLPMRLLLEILVGGDSSRLHQLLVEREGLAISVDGFQDEGFDPGLVYFYLTLPPDADVEEVETRLFQSLATVAAEGVTEAEVIKARNIILADFWRNLATIDGKAGALGNFEVFYGGYENLFVLPVAIDQLTAEDLQAVAADVFRRNNMTVGVLRSPEAPPQASAEETP